MQYSSVQTLRLITLHVDISLQYWYHLHVSTCLSYEIECPALTSWVVHYTWNQLHGTLVCRAVIVLYFYIVYTGWLKNGSVWVYVARSSALRAATVTTIVLKPKYFISVRPTPPTEILLMASATVVMESQLFFNSSQPFFFYKCPRVRIDKFNGHVHLFPFIVCKLAVQTWRHA